VAESQRHAGKTAIITGGGTGIGFASASVLAAKGAHVVLVGRRAEPVREKAAHIVASGGTADWHACDIRDAVAVDEVMRRVVSERGRVQMLFNNAGGQFIKAAEEVSPRGWDAIVQTNLTGTFNFCRAFFQENPTVADTHILNMTIPWAFRACRGLSAAVAARAGVVALTRALALEWADRGVRVNAIAPGLVATDGFVDEELGGDAERVGPLLASVPLGRPARAEEIGQTVEALFSPAFAYMTGHTVVVDGGAVLGQGIDFLTP
jgi:NAD(P)-dependent dehydrogenase (short-subunit alcohol dehydrogenase family)